MTTTTTKSIQFLSHIIEIQSRLIKADFDLDVFMQLVVELMQSLTPATGVVVELIENNEMVYRAATGTVAKHVGLRLDASKSISGLCVRKNEILISEDTEKDDRVNAQACRLVEARSMVVAPLVYSDKALGVLKILSKNPSAFGEADIKTLKIMAGFIASGLAHQILYEDRVHAMRKLEEAQEQLKHMALYDALTDLPNRVQFNQRLTSAIGKSKRMSSMMAFMYLDIDHFKTINDTYGHEAGDELLKLFATRLKKCIRIYDLAARIGGDEFVLILEEISSREDAIEVARKILEIMRATFKLKQITINITTSIGIAFYQGENISQMDLIKKADDALYTAKKSGRNTYAIFSE